MKLGFTVNVIIEVPDDAVQAAMERHRLNSHCDLAMGHFGTLNLAEPAYPGTKLLAFETTGEIVNLEEGS